MQRKNADDKVRAVRKAIKDIVQEDPEFADELYESIQSNKKAAITPASARSRQKTDDDEAANGGASSHRYGNKVIIINPSAHPRDLSGSDEEDVQQYYYGARGERKHKRASGNSRKSKKVAAPTVEPAELPEPPEYAVAVDAAPEELQEYIEPVKVPKSRKRATKTDLKDAIAEGAISELLEEERNKIYSKKMLEHFRVDV